MLPGQWGLLLPVVLPLPLLLCLPPLLLLLLLLLPLLLCSCCRCCCGCCYCCCCCCCRCCCFWQPAALCPVLLLVTCANVDGECAALQRPPAAVALLWKQTTQCPAVPCDLGPALGYLQPSGLSTGATRYSCQYSCMCL
jgi:hypothetical protein